VSRITGNPSRYLPGRLYDGILEPLLRNVKRRVTALITRSGLFPVLDICCGTGRQCFLMAREGGPVFGLDINIGLVRYAASRYPGPFFICADASHLPFRAAAFKGVTISFALHEKPSDSRSAVLSEAKRALRPGGRIVLVDYEQPWNKGSRWASRYLTIIERLAGTRHFRNNRDFLERGGLRRLIEENGLVELERHNIDAGALGIVVADSRD
jgi:ubiquinone/menaquinone biosynthesis C-methylase UbiE